MKAFSPSDMKTILHSKRANLYYLEHCRVLVNGGRVEYVTEAGKDSLYWNIPIANTTCLLLGTGTSISQAAMRELSRAGVLVGFCGGGGTPLFCGNEVQIDIEWMQPQSEYRATEYLQRWVSFWFNDERRLEAAKLFQIRRLEQIEIHWLKVRRNEENLPILSSQLKPLLKQSKEKLNHCITANDILLQEAKLTKTLYAMAARVTNYGEFTRAKRGDRTDSANRLLDHGNYLAYGLGATAAWVLGLPHGLAILHGKTRRGGLVFDIADLIKDALVLPQAFISAIQGDDDQEFRTKCIENFNQASSLDLMIDTVKEVADKFGKVS